VGPDEAGAGKPHKIEPGEEGGEDHEVPNPDPKPGGQAEGIVEPAEEGDRQEQIAVEIVKQAQRHHPGTGIADPSPKEANQRPVHPQVQQQHHHESEGQPTARGKRQTQER
jgi:hypothetical protein